MFMSMDIIRECWTHLEVEVGPFDDNIADGHRIDELLDGEAHPVEHSALVIADEDDLVLEEHQPTVAGLE